jgi:hypothetical protein
MIANSVSRFAAHTSRISSVDPSGCGYTCLVLPTPVQESSHTTHIGGHKLRQRRLAGQREAPERQHLYIDTQMSAEYMMHRWPA